MKKELIIISVMILFIGIIWGASFIFINDKKINTKKINTISLNQKEKRELYAKSIPKVDQEYTISYDYSNNIYTKSVKSEETSEGINISNDSEINILENNSTQNEIVKEEIIQTESNENNVEEIISNVSNSPTETDVTDSIKMNEEENNNDSSEDVTNEAIPIQNESVNLKNGFYQEEGSTYYYENDIKVTGLKNINGVNNYFSPSGKYLGTNNIKVIDVSYYQKDIDWDKFAKESDCYGVILRLGYYETLDKKFERNICELKRLNIPYGIYLFSYSSTLNGAKKEANFTNNMITKYDINPTLGIYYDIESWSTKTSNSNNITKSMYDAIIQHYINSVSYYTNYKYKVKVYSGRWYAMNRLGSISKKYVDWVAEYNKTCKYDSEYSMWQYTSKGSVPGIKGNVDISYLY